MSFVDNLWFAFRFQFLVEDSFISSVKQGTFVYCPIRDRLKKAWLRSWSIKEYST